MGNVIDITKWLPKREQPKNLAKLPKVYNIKLEMAPSETEDVVTLEYNISNKKMRETDEGREAAFYHLSLVLMDMCREDPSRIEKLSDTLEEFLTEE